MPVFNLLSRDRNRLKKIYPFLRRKDHNQLLIDGDFFIEIGEINFNNTNTGTFSFTTQFSATPVVTALAVENVPDLDMDANVNVYVKSINTTEMTIEDSDQNFTGKVHFHVFQQGALPTKNITDNRYRKCYNYIVKSPINENIFGLIGSNVGVESGIIQVTNASTGIHNFTFPFTSIPTITAIAIGENASNVNVFIASISHNNVEIAVSDQNFTGEIHFHAIG